MSRWICLAMAMAMTSSVAAQGRRVSNPFVTARIGSNLVGNTYRVRQVKPVAGAGFSVGVFLSPYWAAEFEWWNRRTNPELRSGPERLYSLSAERIYARTGIQPYLAGGLALLRSTGADPASRPSSHLQVQVTAGVRVPIVRRFALDLDLRGNGGGSTMIVRPTAGVVYFF